MIDEMGTYAIDGVPLDDPAGRWALSDDTLLGGLPAPAVPAVTIPGQHGTVPAGPTAYGPGSHAVGLLVTDNDAAGVPRGHQQLRANVAALLALAAPIGRCPALRYTPKVPEVDVVNLLPNPGAEQGGALLEVFRNECTNPIPSSATGTSVANGSTVAFDSGAGALRVTVPAGGTADAGLAWGGALPAVVAATYTYSAEVEAVTDCAVKLSVQGSGGNGNGPTVPLAAGAKQRISVTVTHTAAGSPAVYVLRGNTNAQEFLVRRMMRTKTPVLLDYFDGSTRTGYFNDPDFGSQWSGTAGQSASIITGFHAGLGTSSSAALVLRSTAWTGGGSVSSRVVVTGSNDSYAEVATFTPDPVRRATLVPGKTYTALGRLRVSAPMTGAASGNGARQIWAVTTGAATGNASVRSAQAPNVAGVTDHRVTFTIPADATYASVRFYNGHGVGSGDVWWDSAMIVEGVYDGPPFDGDTLPDGRYVYRWDGTPHGSQSRRSDVCRTAAVNLAAAVEPTMADRYTARLVLPFNLPGVFWREGHEVEVASPVTVNWVADPDQLAGTTGVVTDPVFVCRGSLSRVTVTDAATGRWMRWDGNMIGGQSLRLHPRAMTAYRNGPGANEWEAVTEDVSGGLSFGPGGFDLNPANPVTGRLGWTVTRQGGSGVNLARVRRAFL